jgi:hypothetical protein
MSHRRDTIEMIRKKTSMSQQIARKDASYSLYAGALFSDAETIALLQAVETEHLFPGFENQVKFLKTFLNERRKAYFASAGSTEITKLGFILGDTSKVVSAKDTRKRLNQLTKKAVSKTD